MLGTREEIVQAALQLSDVDRLTIVGELLETIPDELPGLSEDDPHLLEELERRWQNREGAVPWSQIRDEWTAP